MEINTLADLGNMALSAVPYVILYLTIAVGFMIMNSFVAGYNGGSWVPHDFVDSLLWPLSLAILLGLFCRIGIEIMRPKPSEEDQK